jgi:hypothetical protein
MIERKGKMMDKDVQVKTAFNEGVQLMLKGYS